MNNIKNKKALGFTFIEILGALAIGAIIIAGVINFNTSANTKLSFANIRTDLMVSFPEAVKNCLERSATNSLDQCTEAKIVLPSMSPLGSTVTPCGDDWSVAINAASDTIIVVTYPLDSCSDLATIDDFGADMEEILNALPKTDMVTYNQGDESLTITYSR